MTILGVHQFKYDHSVGSRRESVVNHCSITLTWVVFRHYVRYGFGMVTVRVRMWEAGLPGKLDDHTRPDLELPNFSEICNE